MLGSPVSRRRVCNARPQALLSRLEEAFRSRVTTCRVEFEQYGASPPDSPRPVAMEDVLRMLTSIAQRLPRLEHLTMGVNPWQRSSRTGEGLAAEAMPSPVPPLAALTGLRALAIDYSGDFVYPFARVGGHDARVLVACGMPHMCICPCGERR